MFSGVFGYGRIGRLGGSPNFEQPDCQQVSSRGTLRLSCLDCGGGDHGVTMVQRTLVNVQVIARKELEYNPREIEQIWSERSCRIATSRVGWHIKLSGCFSCGLRPTVESHDILGLQMIIDVRRS